jgi:uncharacterized protein with HEPN domain
LVEIIGEAAANVSQERRSRLTDIPWAQIVGMRNRIVHAYFDIDFDVIYQTVMLDIPALARLVEEALREYE